MAAIPDNVKVGVPLVVSVLSLLFGAFQYFDKRGIQEQLGRQQLRINAANPVIDYLDTDVGSVLVSGGSELADAASAWTTKVEELLELGDLELQHTDILDSIAQLLGTRRVRTLADPQLTFLMVRNTGPSNAESVSLTYEIRPGAGGSTTRGSVTVGTIEPRRGRLLAIRLFELDADRTLGASLVPIELSYVDASTQTSVTLPVREKLKSARFVAPRIRIAR